MAIKKISVVIPLYNVAAYAERAAVSITSQAFDDLEVVLVDDGSTDGSLDRYLEQLSGMDVVAVKQKNQGLSIARNVGIKNASGKYIIFLDGDDFFLPSAITNILKTLEEDKPDVLFGRYLIWNPKYGFSKCMPFTWDPPDNPKKRTEYILSEMPGHSWNATLYICRRELLLENNLFFVEGFLCEDVPWTLAMLDCAKTVSFLPMPFYAYYHRRQGSIMNDSNPKRLIDLNLIVSRLLEENKERVAICKSLISQSFFYINEYCMFTRKERKLVWESYKGVLPLYSESTIRLHRLAGRCRNATLFYAMSVCMYSLKIVYRAWKHLIWMIAENKTLSSVYCVLNI